MQSINNTNDNSNEMNNSVPGSNPSSNPGSNPSSNPGFNTSVNQGIRPGPGFSNAFKTTQSNMPPSTGAFSFGGLGGMGATNSNGGLGMGATTSMGGCWRPPSNVQRHPETGIPIPQPTVPGFGIRCDQQFKSNNMTVVEEIYSELRQLREQVDKSNKLINNIYDLMRKLN